MEYQNDEPCVTCANWNDGCEHYNHPSMIIFGYCAFCTNKNRI